MDAISVTWWVVGCIAWATVIVVRSIRPQRSSLSTNELKRRLDGGDQVAQYEVWRAGLQGRVLGLRRIIEGIGTVLLVVAGIQIAGALWGSVVVLASLLVGEMIAAMDGFRKLSGRIYHRYEAGLLKRVERATWLSWFAVSEKDHDIRVGSREELVELIAHMSPQVLARDDRTMLLAELDFSHKKVGDVMTPRSMVDSVSLDDTIGPLLLDRLHHTGHSRFPVIEQDIDHVVGMLYLHELVGARNVPESVRKAMHKDVYYIGEGRDLEHALHAFLQSHHHLFIVVNEYRETVGILSLEDVIEALIGRSIVDEFDAFDDLRTVASTNPKSNNNPKGHRDI